MTLTRESEIDCKRKSAVNIRKFVVTFKSQEENNKVSMHSHGCKSESDHLNQNERESGHRDESKNNHEN